MPLPFKSFELKHGRKAELRLMITVVSKDASTETIKISNAEASAAWRVVQRAIVCWVTTCTEQAATLVVEADLAQRFSCKTHFVRH